MARCEGVVCVMKSAKNLLRITFGVPQGALGHSYRGPYGAHGAWGHLGMRVDKKIG
jgi:hypothetical protein